MKASANLFLGGGSTYGASTVTQQLVKNLTNDNEVTVRRKLVEIFRALEMEKQYSKEEIMEWYLNTIYLGEQAYGVRTAAYTYFGKDVSELDLAECASLIAITNNPSIYRPLYQRENQGEKQRASDWIFSTRCGSRGILPKTNIRTPRTRNCSSSMRTPPPKPATTPITTPTLWIRSFGTWSMILPTPPGTTPRSSTG